MHEPLGDHGMIRVYIYNVDRTPHEAYNGNLPEMKMLAFFQARLYIPRIHYVHIIYSCG